MNVGIIQNACQMLTPNGKVGLCGHFQLLDNEYKLISFSVFPFKGAFLVVTLSGNI